MEDLFKMLTNLDWENTDDVNSSTQTLLNEFAHNKANIKSLLESVTTKTELLSLCEHYDILDKIVLYSDKVVGFRMRLHVFLPGYYDRPHNHRWSYSSVILRGSYRHFLYGSDNNFDEHVSVQNLKPLMVREEQVGSTYTLHHSMVHSVVAQPYTVSLVIRGPAVKDRFLVTDKKTNETWWQYGAKYETQKEREIKAMSLERLEAVIEKIHELKLV